MDAEEREAIVLGMLARTLDALVGWPACEVVHVTSNDAALLSLVARDWPAVRTSVEPLDGGLNGALVAASARAVGQGAQAVLILPADLPLVTTAALETLVQAADAALAAGSGAPVVAIAPADARGGTNALLQAPPETIAPAFGEGSLEAHLRAAAVVGASVQLVNDPALGFDLDTPDDLERLDTVTLLQLQTIGMRLTAVAAKSVPLASSEPAG